MYWIHLSLRKVYITISAFNAVAHCRSSPASTVPGRGIYSLWLHANPCTLGMHTHFCLLARETASNGRQKKPRTMAGLDAGSVFFRVKNPSRIGPICGASCPAR